MIALALTGLALLAYGLALLSGNWRLALLFVVTLGFLQDLARKLLPGEPPALVLLAVAAALPVGLVLRARGGRLRLKDLFAGDPGFRRLIRVFGALVLLQATHSLVRFGNPVISGIGVMFYIAPLFALWLAYWYARNQHDVIRLLRLYVALTAVVVVTVLLSSQGFSTPLFREVGTGMMIFMEAVGDYVQGHSGIMRTSEIAAWHMAAGACLLVVLAMSTRRPGLIALALLVAASMMLATVLTGRRKVLLLGLMFIFIYLALMWNMRARSARANLFGGVVVASLLISGLAVFGGEDFVQGSFGTYLHRSGTVWAEADDRFNQLGLGSVGWALNRGGFLGLGAGAAAQGAQHFGGVQSGGAGEGGLGKITIELGLPGLVLFVLLMLAVTRHYFGIVRQLRSYHSPMVPISYGLVAFLAANVPMFVVASQVYGDPFVLLILGLCAGFVFAAPRIVARATASNEVSA